jgi:hypothetical protein
MSADIKEIIEKIETYNGVFPREELQILIDRREDATPFLLAALSDREKLYERLEAEEDYVLPFYALFLLAQFREIRAYPLVYEVFSYDAEMVDELWGDLITSGLGNILASVCGGDVSLINQLILRDDVDEWARSAGLTAWLCLVKAKQKTRAEAVAFFKTLFERPAAEDDHLRTWVVNACLDLRTEELLPEIEKSFADGAVDLTVLGDWKDFQQLWKDDRIKDFEESALYDLIDDTIGYLGSWAYFKSEEEKNEESEQLRQRLKELRFSDNQKTAAESVFWESDYEGTFVREAPKVGKNDPCPCGSGRKYKKCCLI